MAQADNGTLNIVGSHCSPFCAHHSNVDTRIIFCWPQEVMILSARMAAVQSRALSFAHQKRNLQNILNALPSQLVVTEESRRRSTAKSLMWHQHDIPFSSQSSPPTSPMKRRRRLMGGTWVPAAYRGGDLNKGRTNGSEPNKTTTAWWKRASTMTKNGRQLKRKQDLHQTNSEWREIRDKERRLMLLFEEFLERAKVYQTSFRTVGSLVAKDPSDRSDPPKMENAEKRLLLSNETVLSERIRSTLQGLQDADVPVDERKLKETEADFVALCKTMQHMCSLSCSLSQLAKNERAFAIYIGISEQILVELVRLLQERCLLTESAHTWGDQAKRPPFSQGKEGHRATRVSKWLNNVINSILSPISKGDPQRDRVRMPREMIGDTSMSEAGKSLDETTERLLSDLVTSIITQTTNQLEDCTLDTSDAEIPHHHRTLMGKAADRVLDVLEHVPTSWDATNDALNKAVQLLSGAASYKSAQKCKLVFERYYTPHFTDPRLSSVLQAYLAAIKHSKVPPKNTPEIIEEAYNFLNANYDERAHALGGERMQTVSVMLQIMAADFSLDPAETSSTSRTRCEMADSLLKKTIGDNSASELLRRINGENKRVSVQLTPLLDPLALLYAISEDPERVELARNMLDHMLRNSGQGRFFSFPSTNTCNAVLSTIVRKHELKGESGDDTKEDCDDEIDLKYSEDLLAFLYQRTGSDCMPNTSTLPNTSTIQLAFRLLNAVKPDDEGLRAQNILSMAEPYYLLGPAKTMGLTLYHETLRTWLRVASFERREDADVTAAEQALWLVERMEIRSTPSLLSNELLKDSSFPYLYDTEAKPTTTSYQLTLDTCEATVDEKDFGKAAEVALTVAKKMERLGLLKHPQLRSLRKCAAKLRQKSVLVEQIHSFTRDIKKRMKQ